jgi:hypothetical protein
MAGPTAISAKQISDAAKRAASTALEKHKAQFPKPPVGTGIFPFPPWWIGFILRELDLEKTSVGAVHGLAKEVASGVAAAVPALKGGEVGAVLHNGFVTVGFIAPPEIRNIGE